ncbi:CDP-diacylglycerol--serine O-phosphatidyltransferase [Persicimonas caeni]|uniref:CDP-diacylglycerol--serine O-phosphatidyltransferase n=1 Tax=Persicimonas caeni TaxID=2292766 RepID=A0A4Y6PW72_PERCE|nr:CDP-diacylglycerol--serine O-phosphatidyltransferase [Persicimonas caeni]QDG52576.1 CDP-diacylglycerol--serine O-phosphatidyltransferase [Persicimonas caeni]QED33798.1 CDP-diacylglycerol--serine O-phosphatidyltransferase [Persicimonas caeni]
MDLSKSKYIFPNLLTLSSVFCGVSSIYLSLTAASVDQLKLAAWLIVAGMLCDLFDGRVARMTNAQSEFGVQLDSLADAVSFGVAPGLLLFSWGMQPLGMLGIFFGFVFTACAIMRLARFNVKAAEDGGKSKYFEGLPTPLAAGAVVSIIMAHLSLTGHTATGASWNVAGMSVILGGLMVSNVRYRTFKDFNVRGRGGIALALLLVLAAGVSAVAEPSVAFVTLMIMYIVVGLGGGLVDLGRNLFGTVEDDEEDYVVETVEEDR